MIKQWIGGFVLGADPPRRTEVGVRSGGREMRFSRGARDVKYSPEAVLEVLFAASFEIFIYICTG